jgi:hypothetical protein
LWPQAPSARQVSNMGRWPDANELRSRHKVPGELPTCVDVRLGELFK